ncbi:MAG: response regulator [Chloroflexota bacterium]
MRHLIVTVDDDKKMLTLLQRLLVEDKHIVIKKQSAQSTLSVLDAINIDLFVIDVMMPNIDGFALCATLRKHPRTQDKPIVILTAHDNEKMRQMAETSGATAFVSKKNLLELKQKVSSLLDNTHSPCQSLH